MDRLDNTSRTRGRGMSNVEVRGWAARSALALVVACMSGQLLAQSSAVTPESEFQKRIKVSEEIQPVGEHPFGESISLYNGALSFEENDIKLTGQGPDIELTRSFHSADAPAQSVYYDFIDNAFVDWSLETPRIETLSAASGTANVDPPATARWFFISDAQRCSSSGGAPDEFVSFKGTVITYKADDWWHGYQLVVPGSGSQDLLTRDAGNAQVPAMTGSDGNPVMFPLVTKARWAVGCTPATSNGQPGEGFVAVSPDGTKYYMDVLLYKKTDYMATGGGGALHRRLATMNVSRVVDRFGNSLTYSYDGNGNLTEIDGSDGRKVTLAYETWQNPAKDPFGNYYDPVAYRVHSITVQPASATPRTWTYSYDTNPVIPRLNRVQLPDGSAWTFNLDGFAPLPADGALIVNQGCTYQLRPQDAVTSTGSITHPAGVTGTFTLQTTIRGRSYVPAVCLRVNGADENRFQAVYKQNSLIQRTLSGAGIGTQSWTYSYSSPNDSWSTCTTGCPTTVTTEMVDPSNRTTRYTFSNRFDASESLLLQSDYFSAGDTSAIVRSEASAYALPAADGSSPWPWPAMLGRSQILAVNADQMGRLTPVTTRTTVQDGDTYTWAAQSFDAFANPAQVTRSNNVSGQTAIVESTSYLNDAALWVLGLPVQVTNVSTGETESVNGYTAQDQLQSRARFGQTLMTYTYDGAGQLASYTDGNGHATSLAGYQRGLPTTVTYPDQTTEHIGVDDFGQVASVTDQAGNTTSYAYDAVGRLAQISYPAGDSVAWAPRVFSYAFVAAAERGIDANHWRRTVTQGSRTDTTYFDALLRPMLTGRYRSGDGALQTTTVTAHDWHGNTVFQSYAVDGAPNYGDATSGITTNYDALSRAVQIIQPSETGAALTTTTSYLSGARKQVTDPRGNTTTTSYQVFDEPTLDHPVLVQAPEGVVQSIARDLYGNPTQIAQGGITKTMLYDAFHRLCRSTEPETASTVTAYDAANNVIWSAKGLSLGGAGCAADQVPAATQVSRSYDALNRVTQVTYPGTTPASSFTYTPTGKLLTESTDGIVWTFVYNKRDLPVGQSLSVDGHIWPVGFGYDANGALGAVSYPDGKAVALSPDALGRPTQAGAYATGASYFPDDQLQHATLGNGVDYLGQRNARNLLSNVSYAHAGALQLSEDFIYDNNGNITAINDLTSGATRSKSFQYDGLDRLRSASSALWGTETYGYDTLNNIVSVATGGTTNTYNYDASNLLRSISGGSLARSFNYDARGNVVQNGSAQYTFDQADRLVAVVGADTYRYDAEGRRVKAVTTAGATTYSLYSHDGQLLWQFDPATNSGTDYIYLGKKLVARTNNVLVPSAAPALSAPASAQASSAYIVSWTSTAATTGYELQEQPDGGAWGDIANTAQIFQSITHSAAGTFHYQVRGCNAGGCGPWSSVATTVVSPPPSAPNPPSAVTATLAGDLSSIGVTWSASATATSYGVQQSVNGGAWTDLYSGSGTSSSVANPGDGTYAYQAHACNANGCSAWVAGNTVRVAHIPPAPASISVPGSSTGVVGVSWSATAYATSYSLEQSVNGGGWGAIYNGGATSFSLQAGASGSYSYRVRACNANGCGGYATSGAVAVTLPPSGAPSISAPGSSNNGAWTVSWTGVAGATSYLLSESANGGGWTVVQSSGSGSWSTSGRGDGSYTYVVAACNVAGCGPNSSAVTVSAASIPPVPANPRYTKTYPNRKFENLIFLWDASPGATRYEVRGLDTPDAWTILPPTTSVNVLLSPFGETPPYRYQVRACNAVGCSAWI